jgi:hypothetical protein
MLLAKRITAMADGDIIAQLNAIIKSQMVCTRDVMNTSLRSMRII